MSRLQILVTAIVAATLLTPLHAQKTKTPPKKDAKTSPAKAKKPAKLPFKTLNENVSYAVGFNFSRRIMANLSQQGVEVDKKKLGAAIKISESTIKDMELQGLEVVQKQLQAGFATGLAGGKSLLSDAQIGQVFQEVEKQMVAKAAEQRKKEMAAVKATADKNKKIGQLFLAKNKLKKGVKETKSGLQYEVIKAGKGKSPKASDTVVTHYRGTLLDGKEFDSSIKRKEPATFPVGGVIPGWTEALQLMKVGAKWKLYIPSDLAYGPNGSRSGSIGPNAMLTFEIELLEIKEPPKPKFETKELPKPSFKTKKAPKPPKKK